jgi:pyruvate dehydrogenase E2 component (dihydrolipoamide acetyltransferase)
MASAIRTRSILRAYHRAVILPLRALLLASHGAYRALGFRSRWVRAGERSVHLYERPGRGSAPPVLLVHGMGGHAGAFLRILRTLTRASRRVVALELPGHGRSRLREGEVPATLLECAAAVQAALREIGEPAVLVGSSLGGALVLATAAALPERTVAVVGLNPAGAPLLGADRQAVLDAYRGGGAAGGLATFRRLYQRPPALGWFFARDFGRHLGSPPVQKFVSELEADLPGIGPQVLDALDKPVLILWGEGDRILPAASVEYFRAHLRRGTVETIPDCGHLPMVEQGRVVAARIARFLAEL